jgi:hypothetical protein
MSMITPQFIHMMYLLTLVLALAFLLAIAMPTVLIVMPLKNNTPIDGFYIVVVVCVLIMVLALERLTW